jgi:uncharacterized protein
MVWWLTILVGLLKKIMNAMTLKRIVLSIITFSMVFLVGADLFASFSKPQFASRLELYETDLRLHMGQWQNEAAPQIQRTMQMENPIPGALEQYVKTRDQAGKTFAQQLSQVAALKAREETPTLLAEIDESTTAIDAQQIAIDELDLRIGILQAHEKQTVAAHKTWKPMLGKTSRIGKTASALDQLWAEPARSVDVAVLTTGLDGWFRYEALAQQYRVSQDSKALAQLEQQEQKMAEKAVFKLGTTGAISIVSLITGIGTSIALLIQLAVKKQDSILAGVAASRWKVEWDWETVWLVLVVGFFFVGQVLLPITLGSVQGALGFTSANMTERDRAGWILLSYLGLAGGGLAVMYGAIKPNFPLAENWFRIEPNSRWWLWGLGGYFVAFPLVVGVSLVNQQIWQGQGGSNPILSIAIQNQDPTALVLIFVTASIAAPFYEETLFRGFLLPSLTRYMPTWGAIVLSSFLFAIVHLSLSEVLPLMALAMVLGFVYTRTQNLLASMLLHSLWNSGTLIALFLMGGSR